MKATLEYNLPEDEMDMKYAMAGLDAILLIDDVINEIRSYLKYESGELKECEDWDGNKKPSCQHTLQRVVEYICELKEAKRLPELI
jgi:hypothetical protein